MSRRDRGEKKISTDSDLGFGSNPFSSLDGSGLPEALPESTREVKVTVEIEEPKPGQWGTIRGKAGEIGQRGENSYYDSWHTSWVGQEQAGPFA